MLVDFLEECMKRHNVDWIDIDEETYLELEEASTQYFLKNRNKVGRFAPFARRHVSMAHAKSAREADPCVTGRTI